MEKMAVLEEAVQLGRIPGPKEEVVVDIPVEAGHGPTKVEAADPSIAGQIN